MKSEQQCDVVEYLPKLADGTVLIIGDVMVDTYLFGDAERISPEAPVPVVLVREEKRLLGGAGNVARNILSLGGSVHLVAAVGNDGMGQFVGDHLSALGVHAFLHHVSAIPTTVKTRVLAGKQQVVRFDQEKSAPYSADDISELIGIIKEKLNFCQAVVISDYGKGMVSAPLMQGVHDAIRETGRSIPVLVDPKPRNIGLYEGVTLLTPNAKETSESVNLPVGTRGEIIAAGHALRQRLKTPYLLTTLGAEGMALFMENGEVWHIPTTAQKVFDVTGAGDTVIASVALALAVGTPILPACMLANYAAGIVVGEVGAATATCEQIRNEIALSPPLIPAVWAAM